MEFVANDNGDPDEPSAEAEAEQFESERGSFSFLIGEYECVQPHPDVSQNQCPTEEQQSQNRAASTGSQGCLVQPPVACFDCETTAIPFAVFAVRSGQWMPDTGGCGNCE